MLRVLSKEESFALLNKKFDELEIDDVIDLAYENRRYPAIVFNIYRDIRGFDVLPLTAENTHALVQGNVDAQWLMNNLKIVMLPNVADQIHPMWNKILRT